MLMLQRRNYIKNISTATDVIDRKEKLKYKGKIWGYRIFFYVFVLAFFNKVVLQFAEQLGSAKFRCDWIKRKKWEFNIH